MQKSIDVARKKDKQFAASWIGDESSHSHSHLHSADEGISTLSEDSGGLSVADNSAPKNIDFNRELSMLMTLSMVRSTVSFFDFIVSG